MGARERGLCPWGLKVSAILEKQPALQRACVFMRMQDRSDLVGMIGCASLKSGGQRVWGVEVSHRFVI